jgi:small subunit ribosomal protein S9
MNKGNSTHTRGRRKSACARVYVTEGSGDITVNGREFGEYFGRDTLRMIVAEPLIATGTDKQFSIKVNVRGGGKSGQAGAVQHAIARAIDVELPEHHTTLKRGGFLTRDARQVERKKYGLHKARKSHQFSKR